MRRNGFLISATMAVMIAPTMLGGLALDATTVHADSKMIGIVRRDGGNLVNNNGVLIPGRTLGNFTSWKLGTLKNINGIDYYQVATNEWIKAASVEINNATANYSVNDGLVKTPGYVGTIRRGGGSIVNDHGEYTNHTLGNFTSWKLDAKKEMRGTIYYRVATNEWIPAASMDINVPQATNITRTPGFVGTIFHGGTLSYTDNGQITNNAFGNYTAWKLDAKKVMNGQTYYRVATNQWIEESAMSVADANGHIINQTQTDNDTNNINNWDPYEAQSIGLRDYYDSSTNTYVHNPYGAGSMFTIYKVVKNINGKYFFLIDQYNRWLPSDDFDNIPQRVFNSAEYEPYFATSVK